MTGPILAIDLGTSSTKALLVAPDGAILDQHSVGYPVHRPGPGQVEQDPDDLLDAVRDALAVLGGDGVPLVFSAAMHSLLALDRTGRPLSGVWIWSDHRSTAEAAELRAGPSAAGLHARTGTPLHPMSPLCKLRWWRDQRPEAFAGVHRFVSAKEYVLRALFGIEAVDHSVASATGLFDVHRFAWDEEALSIAGVDASRLSPLVETSTIFQAGGRDIVIGANDGVLANLGVGATAKDLPCVTLGTSGAMRVVAEVPATDPAGRLFCYVLDRETWVRGGAINNGGLVLRWLRKLLVGAGDLDDDAFVATAATVPPGADGLLFLPHLTGERYPGYEADRAGTLHGLRQRHGPAHVLRAGIEGVMLSLLPLSQELEGAAGARFRQVRVGGGMLAAPLCRQILADVLGTPVVMPASAESSALGAARLGLCELGGAADWRDDLAFRHEPDPQLHAMYREMAARRQRLAQQLDPT